MTKRSTKQTAQKSKDWEEDLKMVMAKEYLENV